jgi:CheY-like chemotaxis protein
MSNTILVIDDDELIRTMVKHFLEHDHYTVITASNGAAGIEKYEAEEPDLVVLDIAMPEINGFEVVKQIRAIQQRDNRSRTPVIFLTAYARSFFLSTGDESGADSFLTKPITPEQLLSHVRRFLGEKQENPGPAPAPTEGTPSA